MKLTKSQQELIDQMTPGEMALISTSEWNDWRVIRSNLEATGRGSMKIIPGNAQTVRGLIKRGILTGRCYWRSYEVTLAVQP